VLVCVVVVTLHLNEDDQLVDLDFVEVVERVYSAVVELREDLNPSAATLVANRKTNNLKRISE
jgi:hypothetical protein